MKFKPAGLLILLGICLFIGMIIISTGLGMVIAPIQGISAPLVCGGDEVERTADQYSYKPGQVGWEISWNCIDGETGERQDRTLPVIFASGAIYGLALWAGLVVWAVVTPAKKTA
jgi:hypothetical protein